MRARWPFKTSLLKIGECPSQAPACPSSFVKRVSWVPPASSLHGGRGRIVLFITNKRDLSKILVPCEQPALLGNGHLGTIFSLSNLGSMYTYKCQTYFDFSALIKTRALFACNNCLLVTFYETEIVYILSNISCSCWLPSPCTDFFQTLPLTGCRLMDGKCLLL